MTDLSSVPSKHVFAEALLTMNCLDYILMCSFVVVSFLVLRELTSEIY